MKHLAFSLLLGGLACHAADLTGNWVVRQPNATDGTVRRSYFDLHQNGSHITGTIRTGQFFYKIAESKGDPESGFTIIGSMMDGKQERRATYEGKLIGDELHLATRRRPDAPLTEMVARKTTPGEGAMPAKIPVPALHKVPDNGL